MLEFAEQADRTAERARQYRERATDEELTEIDRARLLAAAQAIEVDGLEWARLAQKLAG